MKLRSVRPSVRRSVWILVICSQFALPAAPAARAETTDDFNVGVQFYKQERWDASARSFRKFLASGGRSPQAPAARLYLGQALIQQRKFNEARDVFREYVKLHADGADIALARFLVAECSHYVQDSQSAVREVEEFIQRHPGHELVLRARLYRGVAQLRLKDPAAASESLADLIGRNPEPGLLAEAQFALARAAEAGGQTARAVALYEQFAGDKQSPFAAESQFQLGRIAFDAQDYARAAERFAAVAQDFPKHRLAAKAALNAGSAEYSRGEFGAALQHFQQAAADPDQSAMAGMWIGLTHKQAGQLDQAAAALRDVYERDPEQPLAERLLFYRADCELLNNNFEEARRLFASVAERWPQGERGDDSLHLATEAAFRARQLDAADQLNQRFEDAYPDSNLKWLQRVLAGRIQMARGDALREADKSDPAAGEHYRRAVERLSGVVSESQVVATQHLARLHLACAYDSLREDQQVIDTLLPVVDAFRSGRGNPDLADALLVQSHALNNSARHADAAAAARLYLDQSGTADPAAAWRELALAQTHLGDGPAANAALEQLTQLDRSGLSAAGAAYACAEAAYGAKNWELASELFERTAAFDAAAGYQGAALSGLGYSRYEAGQYDAAAAAFAELLATEPDDRRLASSAAHTRALCLQLAGKSEEAIAAYQSGLEQFAPEEGRPLSDSDVEAVQNAYRCGKGAARLLLESERIDDADAAYAAAYGCLSALPAERQAELDKLIHEWALLSYEHQRFERSDELFKLLVEKCPGSDLADDARLYLGESQFFEGDLDGAQEAFRSLAGDRASDQFVKHRASALLLDIAAKREHWDELLESAERFIEQFPESPQRAYARYRVSEAALQSGQLDRAISELTALAALRDDPATKAEWYSSIYVLLGEARFRAKDYSAVEATVAAFRQRFPTSPLLYHADEVLGRSYMKRAMLGEAREAFAKVIASESGRRTKTAAKAQFHIAETYVIEKDYAAALAEYYKVYVNYPIPEWQAPALYQAGQCDETQQQWREAAQSYEILIKEFPDSEFAERARERLTEVRARVE